MITEIKKKSVTPEDFNKMTFEDKLKATDFFVEASSHEQHELWAEWHHYPTEKRMKDPSNEEPLSWVQDYAGFSKVIGHIKNDPDLSVNVSFSFALIKDKYVCFYEPVSRYVDWTMVEEWILGNFPVKYEKGRRSAKTNAANFSNCVWFCRRGD